VIPALPPGDVRGSSGTKPELAISEPWSPRTQRAERPGRCVGRVPYSNLMGNGNWATDPDYAAKVLATYARMVAFAASRR
jgi:hypothetical protein